MRTTSLRMIAVQVFAKHSVPQFDRLRHLGEPDIRSLLLWLDESGLALHFLRRVRECGALDALPQLLQSELASREEQNRVRVDLMLREFARVNEALADCGARYAVLKGFSLTPDFCPDIDYRHHNDLDLLVHADSLQTAMDSMRGLGYRVAHIFPSGEHKLFLPLPRVACEIHEVYKPPDVGILELHLSMCESPADIPLALPDPFDSLTVQTLRGITFPSLSTQDKLLVQMLHTFRHLTLMWIRLSWLYEISFFLETPRNNAWWESFCHRAGSTLNVRNACGLMATLSQKLFGSPIPDPLQAWCVDDLPSPFRTWVDSVGTRWALSSACENRSPVFLQRQFLHSDLQWGRYLRRHLLPIERLMPSRPQPLEIFRAGSTRPVSPWLSIPRLAFLHTKRVARILRDGSIMLVKRSPTRP